MKKVSAKLSALAAVIFMPACAYSRPAPIEPIYNHADDGEEMIMPVEELPGTNTDPIDMGYMAYRA